jgi:hypothetical protein
MELSGRGRLTCSWLTPSHLCPNLGKQSPTSSALSTRAPAQDSNRDRQPARPMPALCAVLANTDALTSTRIGILDAPTKPIFRIVTFDIPSLVVHVGPVGGMAEADPCVPARMICAEIICQHSKAAECGGRLLTAKHWCCRRMINQQIWQKP